MKKVLDVGILVIWGLCPLKSQAVSLCGYLIEGQSSRSEIQIATSVAYDAGAREFHFPTLAIQSSKPDSAQDTRVIHLTDVQDSVEQVGAVRLATPRLFGLSHDFPADAAIESLSSVPTPLKFRGAKFNAHLFVSVDARSRVRLLFPQNSDLGTAVARERVAKFRTRDFEYADLLVPEDIRREGIWGVSAVPLPHGESLMRVFLNTPQSVYYCDLDFASETFLVELNTAVFHRFSNRGGTRLKALSPTEVMVATYSFDILHITSNSVKEWGHVNVDILTDFAAYRAGNDIEVWAAGKRARDGHARGYLFHGVNGTFRPAQLRLESDEYVSSLSAGAISLSEPQVNQLRQGMGEGFLSAIRRMDNGEYLLTRVLAVIRNNGDFKIVGLSGQRSEPTWRTPRWMYADGKNHTRLEIEMVLAGIDVKKVKETLSIAGDIRDGVSARLLDGYAIGDAYNANLPHLYRGDRDLIEEAWRRRLRMKRDLRMESTRIASVIRDSGHSSLPFVTLVYELMDLEERSEADSLGVQMEGEDEDELQSWISRFTTRVDNTSSPLMFSLDHAYREIFEFLDKHETNRRVLAAEFTHDELNSETLEIFQLISLHYLGKPLVPMLREFLEHCKRQRLVEDRRLESPDYASADPFGDGRTTRFWQALDSYLHSVDPLRRVTSTDALLGFFGRTP